LITRQRGCCVGLVVNLRKNGKMGVALVLCGGRDAYVAWVG
jgi:hypothetical protein